MRKIAAVARLAVKQSMRWKLAALAVAVYLAVVPTLPFTLKADGTLTGQLRLLVTWSLFFMAALLGLVVVILSTGLLWKEFSGKQILVLDTKPIPRWQVFVGKYLGMMALVGGLLVVMGGLLYAAVVATAASSKWTDAERAEAGSAVLACRKGYRPELPDRDALAAAIYERIKQDGRLPKGASREEVVGEIRRRLNQWQAGPGESIEWTFKGLPSADRLKVDKFTLRLRYLSSEPDIQDDLRGVWEFGRPDEEGYARAFTRFSAGGFHEFEFPADAVSPDGTLTLRFTNAHPDRTVLIFPFADGVEVLVRVGSFPANLARALAAVFFMLAFIGAVGLCASTFLSGPVAATVVLSLLLIGASATSVVSVLQRKVEPRLVYHGGRPGPGDWIVLGLMRGVEVAFPNVARFFPASRLSEGRLVSWGWLALSGGELLVVRGGMLALLGCWIFTRRELAGAD